MALLIKLADVLIGIIGVTSMLMKFKNPGGLSQKDMLSRIEELERECEQHKIAAGSWEIRYQYLRKKYENTDFTTNETSVIL